MNRGASASRLGKAAGISWRGRARPPGDLLAPFASIRHDRLERVPAAARTRGAGLAISENRPDRGPGNA